MGRYISFLSKYRTEKEINKLSETEKLNLKTYGLEYLSESNIILTKQGKELIDEINKTIYVEQKILNKSNIRRKSISIVDGRKFIVDRGITNSYGIIEKMPKENKKLREYINENAQNSKLSIKLIRGLKAYRKYGILGINGVCIMNKN
jgi:hypothetical protein